MSVADFSLCAEAQSIADDASPLTAKAPALTAVVVALPVAAAV